MNQAQSFPERAVEHEDELEFLPARRHLRESLEDTFFDAPVAAKEGEDHGQRQGAGVGRSVRSQALLGLGDHRRSVTRQGCNGHWVVISLTVVSISHCKRRSAPLGELGGSVCSLS